MRWSPEAFGVAVLTLLAAAFYSIFALQQYWHLHTSTYDSVIFDQAVRAYAHFHVPVVPVKGVHNELGAHFVILGDHFSPIIALLAPLYWVYPHVPTLQVAQSVLFASSIPFVWVFTRRLFGRAAAYLVALAYALAWGFASALATDFHEIAFAVPLIALALERVQARHAGQAAIAAGALCLVKEDFGLFVVAFGAYLAVLGWRRLGLGLAVFGIGAYELTTRLLIPAIGGHGFAYWSYGALGPDLPSAIWHLVRHPASSWRAFTGPGVKSHTLLWLFAPWGFGCLLSPIALLTVPVLAERMFSTNYHYWSTSYHYSASLMPVIAMGSVDGLARVVRRLPALGGARSLVGTAAAGAALVVAVWAVPKFGFHALFTKQEWSTTAEESAAYRAMAHIPSGVTIEADSRIGPHITGRVHVLLLDQKPRGAPWVLVDTGTRYFPFDNLQQARARYQWLLRHHYHLVYSTAGFRLLHRGP
jgi:uncharacterized membrane protein